MWGVYHQNKSNGGSVTFIINFINRLHYPFIIYIYEVACFF